MASESVTIVDFVAKGKTPDEWKMVLVEEGLWAGDINDQLRRVQERLYGCVDGAIYGKLAERFPESNGKKIIVQLDCYNLPKSAVAEFFERFANGIFAVPDYENALRSSPFVRNISFEVNFD
jgi:hypothetical protein